MQTLTATGVAQPTATTQRSYRIQSVDLLRGLVMVIMALDHTRDFIHDQALVDDPLNLQTTTPWLFFTRFITHYCAPVFIFLAGTSGFFQSLRKPKKELSAFLIKRGLWLIAVEVFVISFAFTFNPAYNFIFLQTIWAIGVSMIILGVAVWLPFGAVLALGTLLVFGHNLLDYYEASVLSKDAEAPFPVWYQLLHRPGGFHVNWPGSHAFWILYPFLPWTGLMMLGFCFGKIFTWPASKRVQWLTLLGGALILFFILLRASNAYGDPQPWSPQNTTLKSFFSFINVTKYPPSLLFLALTIGPAMLFLAWAGEGKSKLAKIITVFGRVPFFYYVLHFFLIHLIAAVLFLARGHSFAAGTQGLPGFPFKFVMPGEGYGLAVVYLVWIAVVVLLYPLCNWFNEYKKTHKHWWVSYL